MQKFHIQITPQFHVEAHGVDFVVHDGVLYIRDTVISDAKGVVQETFALVAKEWLYVAPSGARSALQ